MKKAKVKNAKELVAIFREIEAIKTELAAKKEEINKDEIHSGNYKLELFGVEKEKAGVKLRALFDKAEKLIESITEEMENQPFRYNDPNLTAALSFINAAGKQLPINAARQIIKDFSGSSQELAFLQAVFEDAGLVDASIEAKEAAKETAMSETFPRRLSDSLYYILTGDPEARADLSGLEAELFEEDEEEERKAGFSDYPNPQR